MTPLENILKPKTPLPGSRWVLVGNDTDQGYDRYFYSHPDGFGAISALEVADGILRNEVIPQYHLSVSKGKGRRCSSQEAQFICKQFGLGDALEDNHVHSGFVRNFWQPVDENRIGQECHCVDEEPEIKEDKGDFIWRPASH